MRSELAFRGATVDPIKTVAVDILAIFMAGNFVAPAIAPSMLFSPKKTLLAKPYIPNFQCFLRERSSQSLQPTFLKRLHY